MPWKEINTMDEKVRFVLRTFEKHVNFTTLCKEFGISPKTGYKWRQRFLEGGEPALTDLPRTPLSNGRSIDPQFVYDIVKIKMNKKSWGAPKIHATLADMYPLKSIPSETTIGRVLRHTGFIKKKKRRHVNPTERIQHRVRATQPNQSGLLTLKAGGFFY